MKLTIVDIVIDLNSFMVGLRASHLELKSAKVSRPIVHLQHIANSKIDIFSQTTNQQPPIPTKDTINSR